MPIVTINFKLPEENPEYRTATKATDMSIALYEIANIFRSTLKHRDDNVSAVWYDGFEKASDIFWEVMKEHDIDPY